MKFLVKYHRLKNMQAYPIPSMEKRIIFSIDLELSRNHYGKPYPDPNFAKNIEQFLRLLKDRKWKMTFFVVGLDAKKFSGLLDEIVSEGHEIGLHSYNHQKIYNMTPNEFKMDTLRGLDCFGAQASQIKGYRAPYFSITLNELWFWKTLKQLGFQYSSSLLYPSSEMKTKSALNIEGVLEFPIETFGFGPAKIPLTGGLYLRSQPYWFFKLLTLGIISKKKHISSYLHLHDIYDPGFYFKRHKNFLLNWALHRRPAHFVKMLEDLSHLGQLQIYQQFMKEQSL